MSIKNKRSPLAKIIAEALAAGALVFLPVVTAAASPAATVSSADAHVQTVDFKWPWENDDDDRRDDDYYGDDNRNGRQTLRGQVTRDLRGNEFEVRLTNGEIVTVRTRSREPQSLYPGVTVQMRGDFDNFRRDVFIAETVSIVRGDDVFDDDDIFNDNNSNAREVNFPATVLRVTSRNRLTVRGDNGRTYTVSSRDRFSTSIKQGDRVRIIGRASGASVTASKVALLGNGGSYNPDYGSGGYNPDYGNDPNFGQAINFPATVVSVSGDRLTVRGDNGRKYFVTARSGLSSTIDRNTRVRIIGRVEGQLVVADQVRLLDDADYGTPDYRKPGYRTPDYRTPDNDRPTTGQTMNFSGTVRTVLAGLLTVRSDDGQTYTVRFRGATSLRRGERVRVSGTFRQGVVDATSVRRF